MHVEGALCVIETLGCEEALYVWVRGTVCEQCVCKGHWDV